MLHHVKAFVANESGAVVTDYVFMVANVCALGLVTVQDMSDGVYDMSLGITQQLAGIDVTSNPFGDTILTTQAFEDQNFGNGGWNWVVPEGWTREGPAGSWNPHSNAYAGGADENGTMMWVNNGGTVTNVTGDAYDPNTVYELSFDAGSRQDYSSGGFTATLWAGETVIGTMTSTPDGGSIQDYTLSSTLNDPTLAGEAVSITFSTIGGSQTNFDNVSLVTNQPS